MKSRLFVAILAVVFSSSLFAAPAPWYKWKSKLNGKEFCAQTSPGEGWEESAGPFKDARCEKPGKPGEASIPQNSTEKTALQAIALSSGYSMCQGSHDARAHVVCGKGCPSGETLISWSPNEHEQCVARLQPGCTEVKNLHYDLGWQGGHKSNFCRGRGYDDVTNHPGSSYKDHGGGWCYKGDRGACTASLPQQP